MACDAAAAGSRPRFGVRGVSFSRGELPILVDIDLGLDPGRVHALVGVHNSGKSALCALLAGLLAPDRGSVLAQGRLYPALTPPRARALGIARVATPPAVFSRLTVIENLAMAEMRWWLGLTPRRGMERGIRAWLDRHHVELPLDKRMADLPRDAWTAIDILARLMRRPQLLILDESLEDAGPVWRRTLSPIIQGLVGEGMTVLLATQKIEDALSLADSLTVMRRGRAILTGAPGGMERLGLIRLCHDQLDDLDDDFSARESFHELVRYTQAMLNDLPTAIIVLDASLGVRFVNVRGRELFPSLSGRPGEEFGPLDGDPRLLEFVRAGVAAEGAAELHAVPLREPEGGEGAGNGGTLVDVRVQPLLEHGRRMGSMVIIEDVSDREDLRRRLMLSEKLASIGLLAAGVAHEVNNPLEIIGNYINYLGDEDLAPGARKAVARMEVEVARIQHIVDSLAAHPPAAGRAGGPGADPGDVVRDLIEVLGFGMDLSRIAFRVDCPPGLTLAVHPTELRQIFLNLIRNSLDAMPEGGDIAVHARAVDGTTARVVFRDSGPGLQLANPSDVFLPFATTKKGEGGHQGLGLYLVYGIVERHGGAIAVNNCQPRGCEFTMTLPRSAATAASPPGRLQ